MKKSPPGLSLPCPCGAKAPVRETGKGYYAHCPGCGRMAFFRSPVLLERVGAMRPFVWCPPTRWCDWGRGGCGSQGEVPL